MAPRLLSPPTMAPARQEPPGSPLAPDPVRVWPPAWLEILRRTLLAAGLAAAIACAAWPAAGVFQVGWQDWAQELESRPAWRKAPGLTPEAFRRDELEGRELPVAGPAWAEVAEAARRVARGDPVAAANGRRAAGGRLYYRPDEPPASELAGPLDDSRTFAYAAVAGPRGPEHLAVTWLRPPFARHLAPTAVLFPNRRLAPWLLLLALVAYALLPWPRHPAGSLHYHRLRGAILPDLIGAVLFGLFFALPIFVIAANQPSRDLLAGDWAALTIIGWGLSLFGLAILAVAAWYASFRVEIGADGLRLVTLGGSSDFAWRDIETVRAVTYRAPGWLLLAGALVSLLNWRAAAPTLLAAGRSDQGVEVVARDGRRRRFWLTALDGGDRLWAALAAARVPIDRESPPND